MIQLQPTIDYKAIFEVKDLPVSWMSTHGRDIHVVGNYERKCKTQGVKADITKVAELIGGKIAHLKQTTLENGLRYVTIHLEDDEQIFDEHEYAGLFTCDCGDIHNSPAVRMANVIRGVDLGDGFKLNMTISGHSKGCGGTSSYVEKEFWVAGNKVKVYYSIEPESVHKDGYLSFSYEADTIGSVSYQAENRNGQIETRTEPITTKHVELGIHTGRTSKKGNKNGLYCNSSIKIAHNLPNHPWDRQFDQMEFKFGPYGLEKIIGISQGTNPNPEWNDKQVLEAIKKGQNNWFSYNAQSSEAQLLSKAIFGRDVTQLRHDTKGTLNAIMEAAIKKMNIDVPKTLRFL